MENFKIYWMPRGQKMTEIVKTTGDSTLMDEKYYDAMWLCWDYEPHDLFHEERSMEEVLRR